MPTAKEREGFAGIQAQPGLAAMLQEKGGDPEIVEAAQEIESMPGGSELLYSFAATELMKKAGVKTEDTKKVRLYEIGGYVDKAEGGLAKAAETTRRGGRGGDSMLVHMTPEEMEVMEGMWGKADVNPNTGMPEYGFLSKIWKKVKKAVKKVFSSEIFQIVAPIALSIFAPGLGAWIGKAIGAGAGTAGSVVGNALLRGGMSAAGGGDFATGAISGAISGGLGDLAGGALKDIAPNLSDSTSALLGSALASGAGSELTGGDFATGAMQGAMAQMMKPTMEGLVEKGQDIFNLEDPGAGGIMAVRPTEPGSMSPAATAPVDPLLDPAGGLAEAGGMSPIPAGPDELTVFGDPAGGPAATPAAAAAPPAAPAAGGTDLMKYLPLLTGLGAISGGGYEEGQPPAMPEWMMEPMEVYGSEREWIGPGDPSAYYTYGQQGAPHTGERLFVTPEPFAGQPGAADPTGGLGAQDQLADLMAQGQPIPAQMVRGNGGRLRAAGYMKDPNTGTWMPPAPELGQGMPGAAMGGYQRGGEFDYWAQNADVPRASPSVAAAGRYVKGPGTGRSDDIPARLSDGEYVIDAESVALLGDGSGDAGAKRLDEMRSNLRMHKSKNLSKGGFSHKAKQPQQYMARGGMAKLRRAMTESGRI